MGFAISKSDDVSNSGLVYLRHLALAIAPMVGALNACSRELPREAQQAGQASVIQPVPSVMPLAQKAASSTAHTPNAASNPSSQSVGEDLDRLAAERDALQNTMEVTERDIAQLEQAQAERSDFAAGLGVNRSSGLADLDQRYTEGRVAAEEARIQWEVALNQTVAQVQAQQAHVQNLSTRMAEMNFQSLATTEVDEVRANLARATAQLGAFQENYLSLKRQAADDRATRSARSELELRSAAQSLNDELAQRSSANQADLDRGSARLQYLRQLQQERQSKLDQLEERLRAPEPRPTGNN